jgi:outer membrane protein assembly factor BamB
MPYPQNEKTLCVATIEGDPCSIRVVELETKNVLWAEKDIEYKYSPDRIGICGTSNQYVFLVESQMGNEEELLTCRSIQTGELNWVYKHADSGQATKLVQDTLYYLLSEGRVIAFNVHTGEHLWTHTVETDMLRPPAEHNGITYILSNDRIHMVDTEYGTVYRKVNLPQHHKTEPLIANGKLYVGTELGIVEVDISKNSMERERVGLNSSDKTHVTQQGTETSKNNNTNPDSLGPPAPDANLIYGAKDVDFNRKISYSEDEGLLYWRLYTHSQQSQATAKTIALDPKAHTVEWSQPHEVGAGHAPWISNGTILSLTGNSIQGFDSENGAKMWETSIQDQQGNANKSVWVLKPSQHVYYKTDNKTNTRVAALDVKTGHKVWSTTTNDILAYTFQPQASSIHIIE